MNKVVLPARPIGDAQTKLPASGEADALEGWRDDG